MKIKVPNKSPQRIDENAVAVKRACIWHADIHANGDHSLYINARIRMCVCALKQHIRNGTKIRVDVDVCVCVVVLFV